MLINQTILTVSGVIHDTVHFLLTIQVHRTVTSRHSCTTKCRHFGCIWFGIILATIEVTVATTLWVGYQGNTDTTTLGNDKARLVPNHTARLTRVGRARLSVRLTTMVNGAEITLGTGIGGARVRDPLDISGTKFRGLYRSRKSHNVIGWFISYHC